MDKKVAMTAAIVVAFLLSSTILVTFYNVEQVDKDICVLARVNTEGSGIYIASDENPADYVSIDSTGNITYNKDAWRGKVFGTPGLTSIQHMQLQDIVTKKVGLKFTLYTDGADKSSSSEYVYYISSITNAAAFDQTPGLTGGIIWQPQYQLALDTYGCKKLLTSDEYDPGHTCCVVGASHKYTQENPDVTVRFLAAYIKSVDWLNNALNNGGDDYNELIRIASQKTGISDTKVVESSLRSVVYCYGLTSSVDTEKAPLLSLENAVENLVDSYYAAGGVFQRTLAQNGFSSSHEFAQKFINDGYLSQALDYEKAVGYINVDVTVSAIAGDIHQIALHLGDSLGFFAEYGITLKISTAANGAGVATSLQNGEADFALLGAPPVTTTVINSNLVTA